MKAHTHISRVLLWALLLALFSAVLPAQGRQFGWIQVTGNMHFGDVPVGQSAQTRLLTIANVSDTEYLSIYSFDPFPSGFTEGIPSVVGTQVPPGESVFARIIFTPPKNMTYSGTIVVNSSSHFALGLDTSEACSGTGIRVPLIRLTGDLDFGKIPFGSSDTRTLTIHNDGFADMAVSGISYPSGFSGSWSGTVPDLSSQDVTVTFSPTSAAIYSGNLVVSSDAYSGANAHPCSGIGTATRIIRLSGDTKFGDVEVGSSASRTLTIHNDGNSTLTVSDITFPTGFSCPSFKSIFIPSGSSDAVTVTFSPVSATVYGDQLSVISNKTDGDNSRTCTGTGIVVPTRIIRLSGDLDYGTVEVGTTAVRNLTVSNDGNSDLTVSGITYPSGFSGSGSGVIGAGKSADFPVTFTPTSETGYGGTITVASDKTSGINTRSCSGTGASVSTRIIELSGSLAFGVVNVGTNATRMLTISNLGNSVLTVTGITYHPAFSGDWSGTVPAGSFATVPVTFTPAVETAYVAQLTVASDKTSGSNTYTCSGTGFDPTIHDAVFTNCTVVPGGIVLQWIPEDGFDSVLYWSSNLVVMPFTRAPVVIPYPDNTYTDTVHGAENQGFYRIELQP